jgi:glycosyltransferase involved in cell wall biosynthesis
MKVLMMVDNAIVGDSRVQKTAKSVSDLGHEVLLLGRDLGNPELPKDMGNVKIVRVEVEVPISDFLHTHPRKSLGSVFRYHGRAQVDYARAKIALQKFSIAHVEAAGGSTLFSKVHERIMTGFFAIRRAQYSRAWRIQNSKIGIVNRARALRFKLSNNPSPLFCISPTIYEYESAYMPVAIEFQPDVIHAHDFRLAGTGARMASILAASGKRPKVIYDAHEFLEGISGFSPSDTVGYLLNESFATKNSDRIITVSDDISELLLNKYSLPELPAVVLNAPTSLSLTPCPRKLREDCGVNDSVPLGVYLGGLAAKRGISPVLEAMENIPELHFAFVANVNAYNTVFLEEAEKRGISNRVHLIPYVAPSEIVEFVSSATFGLAPYLHDINHEVSLPSKFYEYAIAKLPIVGSDVRVVKRTIEQYGIGEVFTAGDPKTLAEAMSKVINNHPTYVSKYLTAPVSSWTWEAQEQVLNLVYESLR